MKSEKPIVFFDGVCGLCNRSVDFLIKADRKHRLSFASLQGKTAQATLDLSLREDLDTVIFYEDSKVYTRSTAVLKALQALGGAYSLIGLFFFCPQFLRDRIYKFIARNRYSWFGKRQSCRLPEPSGKEFFLD